MTRPSGYTTKGTDLVVKFNVGDFSFMARLSFTSNLYGCLSLSNIVQLCQSILCLVEVIKYLL